MTPFRLLMLLVAVDLISKLAALILLSEGRILQRDALFQFALRRNETGVAGSARAAMAYFSLSESDALAACIGYLGLALALIKIRRRRLGLWRRAAIAIAAYFVPAMLALPAADALVKFSQPLAIAVARGAVIVLIGAIRWVVQPGLFKLGLTFLMAGGIGNFLSLLHPPFRVVDFMYSRLTTRVLGVFNLADLFISVGLACLAVAATRYVVRRFRRSRESRQCP